MRAFWYEIRGNFFRIEATGAGWFVCARVNEGYNFTFLFRPSPQFSTNFPALIALFKANFLEDKRQRETERLLSRTNMSEGGESPKSVQEPVVAAPGEPMDVNTAIQVVLKKALAHDGLSRGLHEACRAIERGQAQLCILADDCNQPDYKKLIEALCNEQGVNLIAVPEAKQLGQWAGLCKIDAEGEARKVVGCSCAVVTDYGEDTEGLAVLQEYLKSRA